MFIDVLSATFMLGLFLWFQDKCRRSRNKICHFVCFAQIVLHSAVIFYYCTFGLVLVKYVTKCWRKYQRILHKCL